jgi:hypothetical protein
MSTSSNFVSMAASRYPISSTMYPELRARNLRLREAYEHALDECRRAPQYTMLTPIGEMTCTTEPLMEDDTKGWQTVRRCMKTCRRQQCRACQRGISRKGRIRDADELEEDANLENWDDVEHYGRSTYVNAPVFEHNGSLFDIGSRF